MKAVLFNSLFIGTGAAVMAIAIVNGLRLFRLLRPRNLHRIWAIQISLMTFFLVGYLFALRYVLQGHDDPIIKLISVIFALGALFVLLTVSISVRLASGLLRLNEELEQKVTERTSELMRANEKLTENMDTLRKTQRQLLQSAKMASVGALAAGVAHELNNPLAVISGYPELLASEGCRPADERFTRIQASVDRMQGIISHLRVFSRDSSEDKRMTLDISRPISNAVALARPELALAGIHVHIDLEHRSSLILGDGVQIESIFQNLLLNSRDAFKSVPDRRGKSITIKTWAEDNTLHVYYSDNATGISDEVLEHIFEPFFTTKEAGHGTGLGLAIVHEIVDQHGGQITARNLPPQGINFLLDFPVAAQGREEAAGKPVSALTPPADTGEAPKPRLLVIDDEISMCHLIHAFLADDFQVNATSDPGLGLDLIANQEFDIILTDLRMPAVSGIDIIRSAKILQPRTPVIAITGFPLESPLVNDAVQSGARTVLNKPFPGRNSFRAMVLNELNPASS